MRETNAEGFLYRLVGELGETGTYFLATVVAVRVRRSVTLLAAREGLSGELTAGC